MKHYYFKDIKACGMCGDKTDKHKILGQRLSQSQGYSPKSRSGISVTIQQCNNCNLIYSNPQPVPSDIQDHYGTPPEDYWKPEYFKWDPGYFSYQISTTKNLLGFKNGMKALDIGAGIGKAMLSMAKAGFDTFGLEPSIPFYEKAISEMQISTGKLRLGAVEELDYDKNQFDFITFGAVFEHLYEPALCLEKVLSWLKPNGIIHIEVPSSKWLMSKFMNVYFRLRGTNYVTNLSPMHSPFHLYEFDLKSFEHLSEKQCFTIEKYDYDVCSIYSVPKVFHPVLKYYMRKTNTGMQLTVYLKKTDYK